MVYEEIKLKTIKQAESKANAWRRTVKFSPKWGLFDQDCISPALKYLPPANFELLNDV
jgi:hypothetical protein